MGFLFTLMKEIIRVPFHLFKFVIVDVVVSGIIGGIFSLIGSVIRTVLKILFKPLTLLLIAGGTAVFYFAGEEQKRKAKALMGM